MKQYWHKNVRPDISKEKVDSITSYEEDLKAGGGSSFMKWNKNGYSQNNGIFRKNGKVRTTENIGNVTNFKRNPQIRLVIAIFQHRVGKWNMQKIKWQVVVDYLEKKVLTC